MNSTTASYISTIGHPLLTLSVFSVVALFTHEKFEMALLHSLLILGCIFVPISLRLWIKAKNGSHTNFDVSDKTQRQSWYVSVFILLLLLTIILFVTEQPRSLRLSVLFSFLLVAISQLVNHFIKSSLHVSLNIFLAFLIIPMNLTIGLFFLIFTVFVAWARLVLKRHSLKEIITGATIGLTVGVGALLFI